MEPVQFEYYSGAGNVFLIKEVSSKELSRYSPSLLAGIGTSSPHRVDGFLLLEKRSAPHRHMHYFNVDGSRAGMCGNGLRCAMKYLYDHIDSTSTTIHVMTDGGEKEGHIFPDGTVEVHMGKYDLAVLQEKCITIPGFQAPFRLFCCDTGVPHAICFVPDVAEVFVTTLGRLLRFHPAFAPHGTNVNFVTIRNASLNDTLIHIRTYERGVEDETGACGTGTCAAALVCLHLQKLVPSIPLHKVFARFSSGEEGVCTCCVLDDKKVSLSLKASAVWHPDKSFHHVFT